MASIVKCIIFYYFTMLNHITNFTRSNHSVWT